MKFEKANCPECGEIADGTVELIPARARIFQTDDGSFEYSGATDVFWDGQYTVAPDGNTPCKPDDPVTLECYSGHQWLSGMTE